MFHKHDWGFWSKLIETYGGSKQQWRRCATCGKAQHRNIYNTDQSNTNAANNCLEESK